MPTAFAFQGHTRRIARAVVETMVPRWPDFTSDLTEPVLERLERTVGAQPKAVQTLVVAGLWGLEVSGPVFGHGLGRLSTLSRDERDRRLTSIAHHPFPTFRQGILLYQTLINLCAYSMPEVEAHLGLNRREWREGRRQLREVLVQLDEGAPVPATPTALGTHGRLSAEEYLTAGAATRAARPPAPVETAGPVEPATSEITPPEPAAPKARRRSAAPSRKGT